MRLKSKHRQCNYTHGPTVLANSVLSVAKANGLLHEDIIGCCALLVPGIAHATGEPVKYLVSELMRRMAMETPISLQPNLKKNRNGGTAGAIAGSLQRLDWALCK